MLSFNFLSDIRDLPKSPPEWALSLISLLGYHGVAVRRYVDLHHIRDRYIECSPEGFAICYHHNCKQNTGSSNARLILDLGRDAGRSKKSFPLLDSPSRCRRCDGGFVHKCQRAKSNVCISYRYACYRDASCDDHSWHGSCGLLIPGSSVWLFH